MLWPFLATYIIAQDFAEFVLLLLILYQIVIIPPLPIEDISRRQIDAPNILLARQILVHEKVFLADADTNPRIFNATLQLINPILKIILAFLHFLRDSTYFYIIIAIPEAVIFQAASDPLMRNHASLERGKGDDPDAFIFDFYVVYEVVIVKGKVESIRHADFLFLLAIFVFEFIDQIIELFLRISYHFLQLEIFKIASYFFLLLFPRPWASRPAPRSPVILQIVHRLVLLAIYYVVNGEVGVIMITALI